MERKRLKRIREERVLAGVCGGVADYLGLDPTLVRVLCVVLAILQPIFIALYLLLAVVLPESEETPQDEAAREDAREDSEFLTRNRLVIGLVLIAAGLALWLEELGWWWLDWSLVGALAFIAVGAYLILTGWQQS